MGTAESAVEIILDNAEDIEFFIKNIFRRSYTEYKEPSHIYKWAKDMTNNSQVAILSARKHLKSTTVYSFLMWCVFNLKKDLEVLYLSYNEEMARYHTRNIKELINKNDMFEGIENLTPAESILKYETHNCKIIIEPAGVMTFKRGRHPDIVICDDILADPSQELNLNVIDKINRIFFEDIMSLPKEGGKIILVGTSQHVEDLFWQVKKKSKQFVWSENKAIINEANKKVLWPEMFSYERLIQIRDEEIGEKAFNKEYMCSPSWSEDSYFKKEEITNLIDTELKNNYIFDPDSPVFAGYDIGKVRHPTHFTAFQHKEGKIIQIWQEFMDNKDYTEQVERIKVLADKLNIRRIIFDDTRGELESFFESGVIRRGLWKGVKFSQQSKFEMAANFGRIIRRGSLRFQNDQRMIRSILSVNDRLESLETAEGHGDAFWSIALALSERPSTGCAIAGAGRYI